MNYLPSKLLKLRKHYGYSQSKLASILDVDTLQYMNFENGNEVPNYAAIKKLASFYHVSIEEIFINDENVTLHDANNATTDDLNIKYFTKRSLKRDIVNFIKRNKLATGIIVGLVLIITILGVVLGISSNNSKPVEIVRENINRISSSSTNVVYIDSNGAVIGTGDNSNSQISSLPSTGAMKVCEGEGFTIILNEDGKVNSIGLLSKYASEVSDLDNIVDIACGYNHVLALDSSGRVYAIGDNSDNKCDIDGLRNVKKIFAFNNGSVGLLEDGTIEYYGNFIGSSSLKNFTNIIDIDSSENILVILKEDHTVEVFTKSSDNYLLASSFKDIVDVACGDDFVAALGSNGNVYLDMQHEKYKKEVASWNNVICISSANDYLVGYDGKKIMGVGKNAYNQFESHEVVTQILPQVSNVKISKDDEYLYVSFDGVTNASGYSVSIDVGTGINKTVEEASTVKFDVVNMQDNTNYTISIVALGNDDYLDSSPYDINYLFKVDNDEEDNPEEKEDEIIITIDEILGISKSKFDSYLAYLGVDSKNVEAIEDSENMCDSSEPVILTVTGLAKGEKVSSSEISKRKIKYSYCKIVEEESNEDLDN